MQTLANNLTGYCYLKNILVFRLKKVLTQVNICVSVCENLGIQANLSKSRNRDSCEHDLGFRASARLRYQRFENRLKDEPRVLTLICQSWI